MTTFDAELHRAIANVFPQDRLIHLCLAALTNTSVLPNVGTKQKDRSAEEGQGCK